MKIVDAHHHLWDLSANYYPWLTDQIGPRICGDYTEIRKNYLVSDYLADIDGLNVVKSVHVQAEHDPSDPVRETRWLESVADDPASRSLPSAIVAYADLLDPDAERTIAAHVQFQRVRGIRQSLHHHERDALSSPVWRSNLRLLERYRLSFDLFVRPDQVDGAVDVLDSNPGVLFILGHAGMPDRREDADLSGWRRALQRLSRCPNLVVKISGLGMFDRAWTVDRIRPIVLDTIDAFGPERCMFGSNFPVDGMMSSYARLWEAFARSTEGLSPRERALLFHDNAVRCYRL